MHQTSQQPQSSPSLHTLQLTKHESTYSELLSSVVISPLSIITPPKSQPLQTLLRSKISLYLTTRPTPHSQPLSILSSIPKRAPSKLFASTTHFPTISCLADLVTKKREIYHVYREKIQANFQQCFLFFMQILLASVKHEYKISSIQINKQKSLLIDTFIFIAQTLVQIGTQKLAAFFCIKGIRLCQIFSKMKQLGRLLYLLGCITRKLQKFDNSIIFLKKALQYNWLSRTPQTNQKQLQIYNLLSHCLLQTNQPNQSKIFAYKYQIGYLQKSSSKIIELSNELVKSVQHRKNKWHSITVQSMELLLEFDIEKFMRDSEKRKEMYGIGMNDRRLCQILNIGFQYMFQNFIEDDMFFYEIPMPLEILKEVTVKKKKKVHQTKFLIKKRSNSVSNIRGEMPVKLLKEQHEKPKEFLLFNYRGVGVSKQKLCGFLFELINRIKQTLQL